MVCIYKRFNNPSLYIDVPNMNVDSITYTSKTPLRLSYMHRRHRLFLYSHNKVPSTAIVRKNLTYNQDFYDIFV